jgi:hypothetical protein
MNPEHHQSRPQDDYEQFDQDMRAIEQFHEELNDPRTPFGALMRRYIEDIGPRSVRATTQLQTWEEALTKSLVAEEEDPADDLPF